MKEWRMAISKKCLVDFCWEPSQTFRSSPLHWVFIPPLHNSERGVQKGHVASQQGKKHRVQDPNQGNMGVETVVPTIHVLPAHHYLGLSNQELREPNKETRARLVRDEFRKKR